MIREQIVTFKVRYDDGSEDVCTDEENCCGVGNCDNRSVSPAAWDIACCQESAQSVEVLQASPTRVIEIEKELNL